MNEINRSRGDEEYNQDFYYKLAQEFKYLWAEWGDTNDQMDEKAKLMITINTLLLSFIYFISGFAFDSIEHFNIHLLGMMFLLFIYVSITLFIVGVIFYLYAIFPKPTKWSIKEGTIKFKLEEYIPKSGIRLPDIRRIS